jgi:NADH:ubiquinone oxidoreductase subunit C
VETGALISKTNSAAPGAFLQKSRFGQTDQFAVWIDLRRLRDIAAAFSRNSESSQSGLDWLENMSVAQVEDALVITYFLRSFHNKNRLAILRGSVPLNDSKDTPVEVPSVADFWQMAAAMEEENGELFGIRFVRQEAVDEKVSGEPHSLFPKEWHGYPLRKSYVFPPEVFGIQHSREVKENV